VNPIAETNHFSSRVAAKIYDDPKKHKPYEDKYLEAGKPELCFSKYAHPSERR
jgi:ribosomal protein S24E